MADLAPEMDFLRALLRHSLARPPSPECFAPLVRRVNWHHTLWLAQHHQVIPWLHLAPLGEPDAPPPDVRAQLELFWRANSLGALGLGRELCLLQDIFDKREIRVISTSGWTLAQRHYPQPALCQVGDHIPFIVAQEDRARADEALVEAGYNLDDTPLRLADLARRRVIFHPIRAEAREDPWKRVEAFPFGGRTLWTLSPADWLIRSCLLMHGYWWVKLRRATDVVSLIARNPASDWNAGLERAGRQGLERTVLLGVAVSHRLLGLPMPELFARRLERHAGLVHRATDLTNHVAGGKTTTPSMLPLLRTRLAVQKEFSGKLQCLIRHTKTVLRRPSALPSETELTYAGRYAPTPPQVVTAMLRLAGTTAADHVYDLGCGDGRIVIMAAGKFGARGVGIDIDPRRIAEGQAGAIARGVNDRVSFILGDTLSTDIGDASVVCLYLQGFTYPAIRRKLEKELRPGTRVVSHTFVFPGWPPEKTEMIRCSPTSVSQIDLWRIG